VNLIFENIIFLSSEIILISTALILLMLGNRLVIMTYLTDTHQLMRLTLFVGGLTNVVVRKKKRAHVLLKNGKNTHP